MSNYIGSIITGYAEMWPREIFDLRRGKNRLISELRDLLNSPGVYVLYRDDEPYYIGKTKKAIYYRVYDHANKPKDRYYRFWNYFSAFLINDAQHLSDIEGLLISAVPKASNNATPGFERIEIPRAIHDLFIRMRRIDVGRLKS